MPDLTLADGTVLEVFSDGSMRVSYEDVSVDLSPLVHGQWNWVQALTTEVAAREKAKRDVDDNADYMGKVRAEVEKIAGTKQPIDLYSLACDAAQFHEEAKRERDALAAQVEVLREALERIVVIEEAYHRGTAETGHIASQALAHQPTEEARQ